MFRTTRRRLRDCRRFIQSNSRLLFLLTLLLSGFVVGCLVFHYYGQAESAYLGTLLSVQKLGNGIQQYLSALYSSCFLPIVLLAILFLCGLSACGMPMILLVPVFYGLGLGLSESFYYSSGLRGVLIVVCLILPHILLKSAALLMASCEAMRMTLSLSAQFTAHAVGMGGLSRSFRLYVQRFLLFLCLLLAAGILDVLLRLLCQSWLL